MASSLFDKGKSFKLSLDDTIPLSCIVESGDRVDDHVEYTLKIYRGFATDLCWQQKKRYTDFVNLDSELKMAGYDLPLPPKKIIGNFDREFVAERRVALHNFLMDVMSKPKLANSLFLKRFLDPDNYSMNVTERALQHVSMVLRSEKKWEVIEPLPDIGWRIRKSFFLVKPLEAKTKQMLSWVEFGPYRYLADKELSGLMTVLQNIKHPHIQTPALSMANENGGLVIRPFFEKGSLKDFICKCKVKGHFLKKYSRPPKVMCIELPTLKSIGRQILETLSLLHEKGLPYGHLHTGNVVIDSHGCRLLDLENWLLGLPAYHRQHVLQFKKIQTTEMLDVYSFGHVMYEMTFGRELLTESCDEFPPRCDATLRSVLESILTTEACKNGLPTVQDLLTHPFFSEVKVPAQTEKPSIKIPTKLKEPLKQAKEEFEKRLKEEQKVIYKKKRVSKAKEYHMSEDKKKERRKSKKKAMENGEVAKTVETPTSPSASAPPPAPPPPPEAEHEAD